MTAVDTVGQAGSERATFLLPKQAYLDAGWYAREQRELFGKVWNLVAAEIDLPEPGDVPGLPGQ